MKKEIPAGISVFGIWIFADGGIYYFHKDPTQSDVL